MAVPKPLPELDLLSYLTHQQRGLVVFNVFSRLVRVRNLAAEVESRVTRVPRVQLGNLKNRWDGLTGLTKLSTGQQEID